MNGFVVRVNRFYKKITTTPDGTLEEVRSWLAKNASDANPRVLNRQDIQGELNLQPDEEFTHLFLKTIGSDDKAIQLTTGFQDFQNAEWSPDGKMIICHSRSDKVHPDRQQDNDLWMIDAETKMAKEFLTWPGYSLSNPSYSPDGTQLLFFVSVNAYTTLSPRTSKSFTPLSLFPIIFVMAPPLARVL